MRTTLLVLLASVFLTGCDFMSRCPLEIGDVVTDATGTKHGGVRSIMNVGSLTSNCSVGVVWTTGDTEVIRAWKLNKVEI